MSMQERHRDVAAYALGVLEPADAFRFEEHLSDCVTCTVQLSDFASLAASLSELGGPCRVEPPVPSGQLLERLAAEVTMVRRRSNGRRLRLVAAAAALIVGAPAAVVALQDAAPPAGRQVAAKDATTGVTASAAIQDRAWGTSVALRLAGLTGPSKCRLIAVGKDGIEHPVLSWAVPAGGYGNPDTPGHEQPLDIQGGTDVRIGEIGRWEVRTLDGRPVVTLRG
ncbi:anti-sigma factor family protein [Streptomyces sp. NPDC002926]